MKKQFYIALLSVCFLSGCYRDNEEMLYPQTGACDISQVSYQATVVPLLQKYGCTGCHSGPAASGNISLDSYNSVSATAQNGRLYGAINHSPGYSTMPKGGSKMTICDINKIKAWIDAGSINN